MGDRLGSAGTRLDLELRVGDTFGPVDFSDCRDESGALVDFTGSTFTCVVSIRDGSSTATITPTVSIVGTGHFRINATATSALASSGLDFFSGKARANWKLRRTSGGVTVTDFYGAVTVFAEDVQ